MRYQQIVSVNICKAEILHYQNFLSIEKYFQLIDLKVLLFFAEIQNAKHV